MAFPSSPQNNQLATVNGTTYRYDSALNAWFKNQSSTVANIVTDSARVTSNTASTNTTTGALTVAGGAGVAGNVHVGAVYTDSYFYANGTPFSTAGALGYTGSAGDIGFTGSASTTIGYTGSIGFTGSVGYTGSKGVDGTIGVDGYTGSQGVTGFTGSVGLLDWTPITANYTVGNRERLLLNSSTGSFTLTLPAAPATGTYIQLTDGANLATDPVTVDRNGSTIENLSSNLILDVPNATFEFIYDGTTWQFTSTSGPRGDVGYTGSASTVAGYTGSLGDVGYTGSVGFTGSVGLLDWTTISADHTAVNRERLMLNSTAGPFTLTLPATPATGTYIQLTDGANLATHNVTIIRNGSTIENIDQDLALDTPNATFEFIYDGSTWQVTSTAGPRGLPGYTGSAGTGGGSGDGYTGSQGDTGFTGSQGEFGYTGSIGFTGSVGAQGDTGFVGSQGRQGGSEFVFQNVGFNYSVDGFADDTYPTLTVIRGQLYYFNLTSVTSSHPLALRLSSGDTAAVPGTTGNDPSSGNFGNGTTPTTVIYQVPFDAPSSIVYQCVFHSSMIGTIEIVDQTGYTGSQGDTGLGFRIAKSYVSVAALTADTAPTGIEAGEFAIIETGSVEDADNSQLYLWTGTAYTYVTDLSGAAGITGPAGSAGFTGSIGFTGSAGPQGDIGFVGSAGTPGEAAAIGYTGSQGFVGSQGAQGVPGIATSSLTVDTFAGTGAQVAFELSVTPTGINQTLVNIDGVAQLKSSYSLSGSTLTFSEAPANGADIEVTVFVYGTSVFVNRIYAGDGVTTEFAVTAGVTADSIIVSDNGIVQRPVTDYSVTGSIVTFVVAPLTGSSIQIREIPAGTGPAGPTGYTGSASTGGTTAAALAGYSLIFGG